MVDSVFSDTNVQHYILTNNSDCCTHSPLYALQDQLLQTQISESSTREKK